MSEEPGVPDDHVESLRERRETVVAQLSYLLDECKALEPFIKQLPDELLEAEPPGAPSLKARLGNMSVYDREVFLPRLERMFSETRPSFEPDPDPEALSASRNWEEQELSEILAEVKEARQEVLGFLKNLPAEEWANEGVFENERVETVYDRTYRLARRDAEVLRSLAQRVHESNITDREVDIPK